jgi:hypothetical protein
MPRRTGKDNINNLVLALLNLIALLVAGFLLEFEIAKANRPDVAWPDTPSELVWVVASIMALGGLVVLSVLALIYKKDLYNRPYLWWIAGFNLIVGLVTLAIISRGIGLGTLVNFVLFP